MARDRHFDVGQQRANSLSNVAGNQYNQYIQQVLRERDSFAREIAATKTKARDLVWLGFFMVAGGAIAYMITLLQSMNNFDTSGSNRDRADLFGTTEIAGYSVGLIGFGIAFIGQFVLVAGIILHIVAASRRKRLLQLPPPDSRHFS